MRLLASRRASDSLAARAAGDGLAELLSSMVSHHLRHDGEMPKSLATWATDASESRTTRNTYSLNSLGDAFGMVHILPASTHADADQVSPIRAADPVGNVRARHAVGGITAAEARWCSDSQRCRR